MKKFIITTTINPVTEEIRKYDAMEGWYLIVTGDRRSPPEYDLKRGEFISWARQEAEYPALCKLVGPDNTMRGRMIALLEAHKRGADLVAMIDDDCMPFDWWPGPIHIGKKTDGDFCKSSSVAFDPVLYAYGVPSRGFPPQLTRTTQYEQDGGRPITPLVQANLWDGQADVDAVYRLHGALETGRCAAYSPFWSDAPFSPFDPQNTIISGSVLKDYVGEIPFVGHVSDIWAGYLFQARHPHSTLYCPATVRHWQDRTYESILSDLEDELYSYRYGLDFLYGLRDHGPDNLDRIPCLPLAAIEAIELYRSYFL